MPNQSEIPKDTFGWTIPQYAHRYQVVRGTVHNWMNKGWLDSVKIGGTRRVLPEHDKKFRARFQSGIQQAGTG